MTESCYDYPLDKLAQRKVRLKPVVFNTIEQRN